MSMLGHGADGLLAPDEELLWQGQPQARIIWRDALSVRTVIGLVFFGFALFWINGARTQTPAGAPDVFQLLFPLLGVPFVLIGLWLALGRLIWDAALRAGTHYTLTNRNAFISLHMFGRRSLESWPLDEIERVTLVDRHPGSVLFEVSADLRRERAQPMPVKPPLATRRPSLGFREITDPRRVYTLIQENQSRP